MDSRAQVDPTGLNRISVTKFDVARRQLATAIYLWFHDGDQISIHTLAFAAYEIVHRLYRMKGFSNLLFDAVEIKEENRAEWAKMLKEDAGFFKHADRDPNATREFVFGRNFIFLFAATMGIGTMEDELNDEESIFMYWCRVRRPDWFDPEKPQYHMPANELAKLSPMSKVEFFAYIRDARSRARGSIGK